ncbi:MAG: leucine-rich repeat domain-containing protein, partial [Erysipelotrichaceae bacterium]|nr:leucine-rich repeat domain-containing protein [Erysipelotrichaceae bacterium]
NISLPSSVNYIGDRAFSESGLESFTVNENTTHLGEGIFAYCDNLTTLDVEEGNSVYSSTNNVIYYTNENNKKVLYCHASGIDDDFIVPNDVYIIDMYAFAGCNMQHVTLNEGLNEIKNDAFSKCNDLVEIVFPQSLETIGVRAFESCTSLGDIVITRNIINLSRHAFCYDYNIKNITIEEGSKLSRLGSGVFGYTGITSFTIPSNITSIAQYAFEGCNNLKEVTFAEGNTLESISAYMFDGAYSLERITFANDNKIKHIQARAFSGMSSLKYVNFEVLTSLEEIDNYAFWGCSSLENVTLNEGLTYIGRYAFTGCKLLTRIDIPESVEYIGRYAFSSSSQLNVYFKSVTLPQNLQDNWDYGIRGFYVGVLEVFENGDFSYALLSDDTISLVKYLGSETSLDISTIDGKIVSAIGGYAFYENTTLQSITLPNTINAIYNYAFAKTSSLQSIIIPNGVNVIHDYAFYQSGITSINLPSSLKKIGKYAFAETSNLNSVTIPNTVEYINDYAFYQSNISSLTFEENSSLLEIGESAFISTKITSLNIPDSVIRIHDNAFYNTTLLSSLTLGNGELRIDANAFYNSGITGELYIPSTTYYIGEFCFGLNSNLTAINVSEDNTYYASVDGVLYKKDLSRLITCPGGKEGSFTIDSSIQSIAFGAFEGSKLSEIIISEDSNLTTIGYRAFLAMKNLRSITIPDNVLSIDYYAFAYCEKLEEVNISENSEISGIYEGAFYNCSSLQSFYIPKGIQEISDYAFYGCTSLTSVTYHPECELKGIYKYAFSYTGMSEIILPETLLEIGDYAFADMPNITMKELNIPSTVEEIGFAAFKGWNTLEKMTISKMYNTLGYYFGDNNLFDDFIYVPDTLLYVSIIGGNFIPAYAFYKCKNIEIIHISQSITIILPEAFEGHNEDLLLCLESDTIPINYAGMPSNLLFEITSLCVNDSYIYVIDKSDNAIIIKYIGSETNIIINGIDGHEVSYIYKNAFYLNYKITSVEILDSIKSIDDAAFSGCEALVSIVLPDGLLSIGSNAFNMCISLTSIAIPNSVTSIGKSVFNGCSSLSNVEMSSSITIFEENAFRGCSSLTSITIPDGVTSIGNNAFNSCSSLTNIVIPDTVKYIGNYTFSSCINLYILFQNDNLPENLGEEWNGGNEYFLGVTKFGKNDLFVYLLFNNNSALILKYIGSDNEIEIGKIEECDVTIIYKEAFRSCVNLQNISFGNNSQLTSIGEYAFYGCSSLTSITIPDSVTSIGSDAFSGCSSLASITIPNSVTSIGDFAFWGCCSLTSITIPNSVTSIGKSTFNNCSSLTSITIPNSVSSIGASAFSGCSSLASINIPDGVTSIGDYAFSRCSSLASINIPDGVTSIGASAFSGCFYLMNVSFESNSSLSSIGNSAFSGCSSLASINIPDGVTSIGDDAFYYCRSLTSITFPDSVTSIGNNAFENCENLTSILIPESVTSIGNNAFRGIVNLIIMLKSNELPEMIGENWNGTGNYYLGIKQLSSNEHYKYLINNSDNAIILEYIGTNTDIIINNIDGYSVSTIGEKAFYGCRDITRVTLPSDLNTIMDNAFENCYNLTSILIPESVTSIGNNAFYRCNNLTIGFKSNNLPENLGENWNGGRRYFLGIKLISSNEQFNYIIDNSDNAVILKYIGTNTEIIIDKIDDYSVSTISAYAFKDCTDIVSINMSNSVIFIDEFAFDGCSSLTSIVLSRNITNIDSYLFGNCSSLISVDIPDSVTSIGYGAFSGCSSLTSISIPDSVTSIEVSAFSGCSSLTSITIPNSVKSIGASAFSRCSSLESIVLPESMSTISSYLFKGCSSLTSVFIHDSITIIMDNAFSECTNLKSIKISDSVTAIGNEAFYNCSNLSSVNFGNNSKLLSIGNNAFYKCVNLKEFEIPLSVVYIYDYAFNNCSSLTNIKIPEGITNIGNGVFNNCSSLINVEIPSTVLSIGNRAFYLCSKLDNIILPENVSTIGSYAFGDCSSLKIIRVLGYPYINANAFYNVKGNIVFEKHKEEVPSWDTNWNQGFKGTITYLSDENYQPFFTDGLTFALLKNGTYSINGYNGTESKVIIPNIYQGLFVTNIGVNAFKNNVNIASVTIPNSITSIGNSAFSGCVNLMNVSFESNSRLSSIGNSAFSGCSSLASITIPNSVTSIGSSAFAQCSSLASITIPNSVTSIGYSAFYECVNLMNVSFESNSRLSSIGTSTFYYCSSLASITIPNSVTSIGASAFERCSSLASITIPNSVASIGASAFDRCVNLMNVSFESNSRLSSIGNGAFYGCSSLSSITIPNSVTSIGAYAFEGCSSLASINIPDGVTSIGDYAFYDCEKLKIMQIPESVTSIGDYAFNYCLRLSIGFKSKQLPNSLGIEWNNGTEYYLGIIEINANDQYKYILKENNQLEIIRFIGDESIISIERINGINVTSIGKNAFEECYNLKVIVISETVTNIDANAFEQGSRIKICFKSEQLPESLSGNSKFDNEYFLGVKDYINDSMFEYLVYKDGNVVIFKYIGSENRIEIGDLDGNSVTSIYEYAFSDCSNLTSIIIPKSVTNIGAYAFDKCSNLIIGFEGETLPEKLGNSWNGNRKYYFEVQRCNVYDNIEYFVTYSNTIIVIGVCDKEMEYIYIPDKIEEMPVTIIYENLFLSCTLLKYLRLPVITYNAFPDTLRQLILSSCVDSITDFSSSAENVLEIYCYQDRNNCEWEYIWKDNCISYFLNEWNEAVFHDYKGNILAFSAYKSSEILRVPADLLLEVNEEHYIYSFIGWDINNDGVADTLPAILKGKIIAYPLYEVTCKHDIIEWVIDIEPYCVTTGLKHKECSVCGEMFEKEVLAALGHSHADAVEENRVEATCLETGYYESVVYCSVCGEELSRTEITLDALDHDLIHHEAVAPTCTEIGWNKYDTCSRCDYSTYVELAAIGHTHADAVEENRVEPTCLETGHYDSVVYCSVCGEELSRTEITLDALGHTSSEVVEENRLEPTCLEAGHYDSVVYCSACGEELSRTEIILEALGHTPAEAVEENRLEPTCLEAGHYDSGVYWSVCGEELSRTESALDALGHDLTHHEAKAPTCTEIGWEAYDTCSRCDYSTYNELSALGHTPAEAAEENRVEPTCLEVGHYDSVVYCSVCGEELSRSVIILEALGHDLTHHEAKDATCTEIGWEAYDTCSRCDYSTYNELSALGHTPAEAVEENRVEPTCLETGHYESVVYCSVCGEELSRTEITLEALGHDLTHHEAKDATCTEKGWNEYYTCSRCDYSTYNEISALGHTPAEAVEENKVEATCLDKGHYDSVVYCSVCGEELSRSVIILEALGHKYDFDNISWSFADDYSSAIATLTCFTDNTHVLEVVANITSSTNEEGKIVYTATAEIAGKIYSYEKIVDAPNDNKIDFGCNGMVNESSVAGNIVLVLVAFIIALIKRRKSKMLG